MMVKSFENRIGTSDIEGNAEIVNTFSAFEKELMTKMQLVEVVGKQNRKVPILLTPNMVKGLETLIKYHRSPNNPYVFEKVVSMTETELEEVARHMGHELAVHRKLYRLQEDVTELAKVSKLLLAVENGCASRFNGKCLDDIDMHERRPKVIKKRKPVVKRSAASVSEQSDSDQDAENKERPKKVLHKNKFTKKCDLDSEQYDSDQDPEYKVLSDDSRKVDNSESEMEISSTSHPHLKRTRIQWQPERSAIENLILPTVIKNKKPPRKQLVMKAKKQSKYLQNINWKQIKYTDWSMFQQYQGEK